MKIAIAGAGPTGLYLAMALARRGNAVTLVDRDAGPSDDNTWSRKGVMQFEQPHFFRPQIRDLLLAELPEVVEDLVAAGAEPTEMVPQLPDFLALRTRRSTFEWVFRTSALNEPGVTFIIGHADSVAVTDGAATGLIVDGQLVNADLVIDATGRSGRLTDEFRAPAIGGDSGFAYAARQYQLLPGAEPGPLNAPPGWAAELDGYVAIVFLQDAGVFQPLLIRRSDDKELAELRHVELFERAANSIPALATWLDPERSRPISGVMAGAGLFNSWQGQLDSHGKVGLPGLIAVGDTVMATDPADGKGVTTSLMQAHALLQILDKDASNLTTAALEFHAWCEANLKPWYDDMVDNDMTQLAAWSGSPIDLDGPLSSEQICRLADVDPSVMPIVGPYWAMLATPDSLRQLEERARDHLKSRPQPTYEAGPTRAELVALISS